MQKLEQGYLMFISLFALMLVSLMMHWILTDLSDLMTMVYTWRNYHLHSKNLDDFSESHLNFGKFDYHWDYLGEYPCIQLCQPDCQGTRHWKLNLRFEQHELHLRVLRPDRVLKCLLPHPIHFQHAVIWTRKF